VLDLDVLDAEFSRIVGAATGKTPVAPDLAKAYDAYAKDATIPGADCSAGGNVSVLEAAFTTDNTPASIARMAAGVCAYWQALPIMGTASHEGTVVVSVLPTFAALVPAMTAVVTAQVTTSDFDKPYKRLFKAIEDLLKTASIAITETMPTVPPSPMTFPEFLQ